MVKLQEVMITLLRGKFIPLFMVLCKNKQKSGTGIDESNVLGPLGFLVISFLRRFLLYRQFIPFLLLSCGEDG